MWVLPIVLGVMPALTLVKNAYKATKAGIRGEGDRLAGMGRLDVFGNRLGHMIGSARNFIVTGGEAIVGLVGGGSLVVSLGAVGAVGALIVAYFAWGMM